jgi:hypothetical protein
MAKDPFPVYLVEDLIPQHTTSNQATRNQAIKQSSNQAIKQQLNQGTQDRRKNCACTFEVQSMWKEKKFPLPAHCTNIPQNGMIKKKKIQLLSSSTLCIILYYFISSRRKTIHHIYSRIVDGYEFLFSG